MENQIQTKLDEIKNKINKNIFNYDLNKVSDLLDNLNDNLVDCVKINHEILDFFRKKSNFRIIQDLKDFGFQKLKFKVKGTRRSNVEEELARFVSSKHIQKEKLELLLGKSETIDKRIQKKTTVEKEKVEDQTSRWMGLTLDRLEKELNDLNKYPSPTILKKAAYSILLPNERRFRKREKIIKIIVERINEDKAIAHLGR